MSKKKLPAPRNPGGSCSHGTTRKDGPHTVTMPKGPHQYYKIYCVKCGAYLRNEDA